MRLTKSFIPTLKEVPADAVIPSHVLMLRSGMVRMLSAGIYSFLPLGYRVLQKITSVIREEMNSIDAQELHLPALNPKEIWETTGRVEAFGDIMFHLKNRDYVLAPTHEEIIAQIAKGVISSYKDMPQIWYQIQTKFRNEARPRSGVIRGRQFLMKDSYSLDSSYEGLDLAYEKHAKAYRKIFDRLGIRYVVVGASSGAMGGSKSQEFMVQSEGGEDMVVHCPACKYSANLEVATSKMPKAEHSEESKEIFEISTPGVRSIDDLCSFLSIDQNKCAKTRVYVSADEFVMVLMLGNDEVNETKLEAVLGSAPRPARLDELSDITGADAGSIGPIGFKGRIIADKRLEGGNNLYTGASKNDFHIGGLDLKRDVPGAEYADLRNVISGEECPECSGKIDVFKSIELGHIFKLGTRYSAALGANFLDLNGKENPIVMGSYGIGVERVMACYIEQHYDDKGIVFGEELAPFKYHLIALNLKKEAVREACEKIYQMLGAEEVLYDDRDQMAGFKFKDADLLGMPLQIIVGEKNLKEGLVEVKVRSTGQRFLLGLEGFQDKLKAIEL